MDVEAIHPLPDAAAVSPQEAAESLLVQSLSASRDSHPMAASHIPLEEFMPPSTGHQQQQLLPPLSSAVSREFTAWDYVPMVLLLAIFMVLAYLAFHVIMFCVLRTTRRFSPAWRSSPRPQQQQQLPLHVRRRNAW